MVIKYVVFVGSSGSGKTTLSNELNDKRYPKRFLTIMSTTTRPPRESDTEYRHVTQEDFQQWENSGRFAWEPVKNEQGWYGTLGSDLGSAPQHNRIGVLILTPETACHFKHAGIVDPEEIFVVYTYAPEQVRTSRLIKRGEKKAAIEVRIKNERIGNIPWDDWCSNYRRPFVDRWINNDRPLEETTHEFHRLIRNYVIENETPPD